MKQRFNIKAYKKYEADFWGNLIDFPKENKFFNNIFLIISFKYLKFFKILRFLFRSPFFNFRYSVNISKRKFKPVFRNFFLKRIHNKAKFRIFYGDLTNKKIKNLYNFAKKKNLNFFCRFIFLFEGRLDVIIFRLNFFKTIRQAKKFVKYYNIFVNGTLVKNSNKQLYIGDVLTFKNNKNKVLYNFLLNKIKRNKVIFNYPKYLEINYNIMTCIFLKYPILKDLSYCFDLNLTNVKNYINF